MSVFDFGPVATAVTATAVGAASTVGAVYFVSYGPIGEMTEKEYRDTLIHCLEKMTPTGSPGRIVRVEGASMGTYGFSIRLENRSKVLALEKDDIGEKLELNLTITRAVPHPYKLQAIVDPVWAVYAPWPEREHQPPPQGRYAAFMEAERVKLSAFVRRLGNQLLDCFPIRTTSALREASYAPSAEDLMEDPVQEPKK